MFHFLPGPVSGVLSFLLYTANTLFWVPILLIVALFKFLAPFAGWRRLCNRISISIANNWVGFNNWSMRVTKRIRWDVRGIDSLKLNEWYLVVSNHQSWVDILVLQKIFHRKIPLLKFFLKKELIWVPFLGAAWWALDFPFMKRYSKTFIEKHPHLKGKDIEITKKACEKFKTIPVSIMNFVEGTRFTLEKHRGQHSPYAHLLKPRAGGIAFTLAAMGEQLHRILNVTIAYPQGQSSFWAFLCGRVGEIKVNVESLPIHKELLGDYFLDKEFSEKFQKWLNVLWAEKDKCFEALLASQPAFPEAVQSGEHIKAF